MNAFSSLAARTVFLHAGYTTLRSETVERGRQNLVRLVMQKGLEPV